MVEIRLEEQQEPQEHKNRKTTVLPPALQKEPLPRFEGLSEEQQAMLDLVYQGATPNNAAMAAGISDWKADPAFFPIVNKLHAINVCAAEAAAHRAMVSGKAVPSGLQFYLQCQAGWRNKFGEDGFAQDIEIHVQPVDGFADPDGPEAGPQVGAERDGPRSADAPARNYGGVGSAGEAPLVDS